MENKSTQEWQDLTQMTRGETLVVERVRWVEKDISIEGRFELPPLARLASEDQVFLIAFAKSHGSIKDMEQLFGVSYPTIKSRLHRIAAKLEFVETDPSPAKSDTLERLRKGEITAQQALEILKS